MKAPPIALRTRTRNKKVSLTGSPRNAGNATCRARGFGALCHRPYKALSKRNEMMYAGYRRTFEHKTSPLFRGDFSPRRGHADVTIRSFKKSNRPISYQPPDFGSRQINGWRYVSVGTLARGNAPKNPGGSPEGVSPSVAGARCPQDCRQDAGGTIQGATMKAGAPINLLNLPMIFHGRDARATFGKR